MKKFIGLFMLILCLGAYANETKLNVAVRANLVTALTASADGSFGEQIFTTEEAAGSTVNLNIKGQGNETVEVKLLKEITMTDGGNTVKYGFDFDGAVESPDGSDVYKVGILRLDGTGVKTLAINGKPQKPADGYKKGDYNETLEIEIKYI